MLAVFWLSSADQCLLCFLAMCVTAKAGDSFIPGPGFEGPDTVAREGAELAVSKLCPFAY